MGRRAFAGIAVLAVMAAIIAGRASAFDRKPVTVGGLQPDRWGNSTTGAETDLRRRFAGISVVYCAGVMIPGDPADSSWVHGLTRYWDKLACSGYTSTTGHTIFTLIYDAKGPYSFIVYRLKNVSSAALRTP